MAQQLPQVWEGRGMGRAWRLWGDFGLLGAGHRRDLAGPSTERMTLEKPLCQENGRHRQVAVHVQAREEVAWTGVAGMEVMEEIPPGAEGLSV